MRTVRFVMTGPPTTDAGSFVGIVDDDGQPVSVGWWQHDGAHWVYVMPVRMVPELVVPNAESMGMPQAASIVSTATEPIPPSVAHVPNESALQRQRRMLKERVKGAAKKEIATVATTNDQPVAVPANWEKCPSCGKPFDPQKDELMDCSRCSEPKCTRECLTNVVEPCVDCQALEPDKHDDDDAAAPPASALFSGKQINDPETMRRLGAAAVELTDDGDGDNE